jgi:CMP-2-keto-3-deoxyoctulosonic acid synthetase
MTTLYTKEILDQIVEKYNAGVPITSLQEEFGFSQRSLIAKLSSMGVYKKKEYVNKRGETPVRKEEIIEKLAKLLEIDSQLLESMEKVTKTALILIERKIEVLKAEAGYKNLYIDKKY